MQVVIAGGGPAGAVCARALARAGVRTVLIEASPSSEKPCAGGLPSVLFKRYTIPELLVKQRATGVVFQAPSGLRVEADFSPGQFIATVNRREFDSHLRWAAEDAGAVLVRGRVLSYDEKGPQMLVRYMDRDGHVRTTEADFLVGADGAWSRVAMEAMGKRLPMVVALQEEIIPTKDRRQILGSRCLFNYSPAVSPDFYGWIFPKGDAVSVGIGTMYEHRALLGGLLDRLKELHGDLLDGGDVINRNGALIPAGQHRQHGAGRIVLVGDAAGLVVPACGEGVYFAMRSGEIAGEVLAKFGAKRPDLIIGRYTDTVNAEFGPIFRYFRKIDRIIYSSVTNREVFVRLAQDRFMASKILTAFASKTHRRTPTLRKLSNAFKLLSIRLDVYMHASRQPDFGK